MVISMPFVQSTDFQHPLFFPVLKLFKNSEAFRSSWQVFSTYFSKTNTLQFNTHTRFSNKVFVNFVLLTSATKLAVFSVASERTWQINFRQSKMEQEPFARNTFGVRLIYCSVTSIATLCVENVCQKRISVLAKVVPLICGEIRRKGW